MVDLGPDLGLYTRKVVAIRYRRRLGALCALATAGVSWTLLTPASALTVTTPTLPAPLPVQLPVGGSVSTGTGGDPLGVAVTLPDGSGVDVEVPGVPTTLAPPVTTPTPESGGAQPPVSPSPRGGTDPTVSVPDGKSVANSPPESASGAQPAAGAAAPAGSSRHASVNASIDARPASDSLLHRIPMSATRVALLAALAAIVFVLQMLVASAVREHRRKAARAG